MISLLGELKLLMQRVIFHSTNIWKFIEFNGDICIMFYQRADYGCP